MDRGSFTAVCGWAVWAFHGHSKGAPSSHATASGVHNKINTVMDNLALPLFAGADKQYYGSAIRLPGSFSECRGGALVASAEDPGGFYRLDGTCVRGRKWYNVLLAITLVLCELMTA